MLILKRYYSASLVIMKLKRILIKELVSFISNRLIKNKLFYKQMLAQTALDPIYVNLTHEQERKYFLMKQLKWNHFVLIANKTARQP